MVDKEHRAIKPERREIDKGSPRITSALESLEAFLDCSLGRRIPRGAL